MLWALLVGGAILVVAALLIFWPAGDASSGGGNSGGPGGKGGAGHQSSLAQGRTGPDGQALGVGAREIDPNRGGGRPRVNSGLIPAGSAGHTLAPPKKVKPEPTSFASPAAEIAYWERKLVLAEQELAQRTLFVERMKKAKEDARTSEQIEIAERRGKVVEKNYLDQKQKVDDLTKKVADLKEKQRQTGSL